MATVDDAIELLTDPAYRTMGPADGPMVQMRAGAVVNELRSRSAPDEVEAWALIREALGQLKGAVRSEMRTGGLGRGGHPRAQRVDHVWVPRAALRA